jgi:glycosyltransferase involved in cell wall biosynthesis
MYFPKISIVTPSFNQGHFIEETITSIINQDYPNLEYIIIDGGSTDNTIDIIKKYSSKISYWISEKDKGQTEAINKGLLKCSGEIFNWINSDDYLEPGALLKIAEEFNKGYVAVCGRSNIISFPANRVVMEADTRLYNNLPKTIAWVKNHQPATFYKLDLLRSILPLSEMLHYTMDQELWIKFLLKYGQEKIKVINEKLVNFRVHENSKTGLDTDFAYLGLPYLFFRDYNTIFYSISLQHSDERISTVIKSVFKETSKEVKGYSFPMPRLTDNIIPKVLNYYLFRLLVDLYLKADVKRCKMLLKATDISILEKEDKLRIINLKLRVLFFPVIGTLKKILRRK